MEKMKLIYNDYITRSHNVLLQLTASVPTRTMCACLVSLSVNVGTLLTSLIAYLGI